MRVVCIVQARVGSSRLPEKVLKNVCGKTILEHDILRLRKAKTIDELVIATTDKVEDNKIVEVAEKINVKYFRGSELDVLARYYHAANENKADIVIRVTSDCPCIDYRIIDTMVNLFKDKYSNNQVDYLNNTIERTFPRGYDVEIFTMEALTLAYNNAKKDYEREHVTPYIYDLNNKFKIVSYKNDKDYSKYRVTLDTEEDFCVIKEIYNNLYNEETYFGLEEVIEFLEKHPNVSKINEMIEQKKLGE